MTLIRYGKFLGTCDGRCPFICLPDHEPKWLKIRNRSHFQWVGWEKLFERDLRGGDPDFLGWDDCVRAVL